MNTKIHTLCAALTLMGRAPDDQKAGGSGGATGATASDAASGPGGAQNATPATKPQVPIAETERKAKEEASRLAKEAEEAQAFALEAAAEATKRQQAAAAAKAVAEGKVLANVPSQFILNHEGISTTYPVGTYPMPKDHANHAYARAHGVKVLGLPVPEESAK